MYEDLRWLWVYMESGCVFSEAMLPTLLEWSYCTTRLRWEVGRKTPHFVSLLLSWESIAIATSAPCSVCEGIWSSINLMVKALQLKNIVVFSLSVTASVDCSASQLVINLDQFFILFAFSFLFSNQKSCTFSNFVIVLVVSCC